MTMGLLLPCRQLSVLSRVALHRFDVSTFPSLRRARAAKHPPIVKWAGVIRQARLGLLGQVPREDLTRPVRAPFSSPLFSLGLGVCDVRPSWCHLAYALASQYPLLGSSLAFSSCARPSSRVAPGRPPPFVRVARPGRSPLPGHCSMRAHAGQSNSRLHQVRGPQEPR